MKATVILQVSIPVEYDEIAYKRMLEDLSEFFNSKYNKTSNISCSTEKGTYSWHLPKVNAQIIDVIKN